MNVDMHCHLFVEPYVELLRAQGRLGTARLDASAPTHRITYDDGRRADLDARSRDPDELARAMSAARLDHAVLSPPPMTLHTDLGEDEARLVCASQNEGLSQIASAHPDRFAFFAAVPLQHPRLTVEMLDTIARLPGAVGIEIPAVLEGRDLDSEELFSVFARARDLRLVVFIHPGRPHTSGLLGRYSLSNILANPLETTMAAAALAFGGVMERLPGLKVLLCHGAGALPYLRGRMRHGYTISRSRQSSREEPDRAFAELYADTLTHDDDALALLVRTQGPDRLVLGTDYPFAMGEARPVEAIDRAGYLSADERARICGRNAARLIGRWG